MTGLVSRALRSPLLYLTTLLIACLVYFSVANPDFGNLNNFKGIAAGAAVTAIVAIGVTLGLAAGCIDFSIAGNMALTGVAAAWLDQHLGWGAAMILGLAGAAGIGLLTGLVVVRFGINPFIATLASAGALRGLAFLIGGAQGILINNGPLLTVGQQSAAGIPNTVIVMVLVTAVAFVALRSTGLGRSMLAVGGNPEAARLAGIRVSRIRVLGYVISAVGAGLAGILLAGRTGAGLPQAASGQELLIFSAAILGGTSLWGGRASVVGSLLGVLLINVLYNGLTLEQISPYWQTMIQGVLLIVAVWLVQQHGRGLPAVRADGKLLILSSRSKARELLRRGSPTRTSRRTDPP